MTWPRFLQPHCEEPPATAVSAHVRAETALGLQDRLTWTLLCSCRPVLQASFAYALSSAWQHGCVRRWQQQLLLFLQCLLLQLQCQHVSC
jgi:hypothetical protein